jgi:hypothetical protein
MDMPFTDRAYLKGVLEEINEKETGLSDLFGSLAAFSGI